MEIVLTKVKLEENLLGKYDYVPFQSRVNNVISLLEERINSEITSFLGFPVFNIPHFHILNRDEYYGEVLNGDIYSIGYLKDYIGDIPLKNQKEIVENFQTLDKNPFIETIKNSRSRKVDLFILAPENNFASTSNVSGIDPIVFVHCKINDHYVLIPLTQWD